MRSIVSRLGRVYRVLRRVHGRRMVPLLLVIPFLGLRVVTWLAMKLDYVFFPRLWRTRTERPIVLVGNPRTGTTFLQRFLAAEGFGAGLELYRMVYPSLVLQALLRPLLPLLEWVSPTRFYAKEAHATSLRSVETDEAAVMARYFDGFFLYAYFLAFEEGNPLPAFDPRNRDTTARDFAWYEALWRRGRLAHRMSRIVAKPFSLTARLPAFLERFPDARILYTVRDPLAVIPSTMSLVSGALDNAFGFWSLPEETRRRWTENVYRACVLMFRRFYEDWTSGAIDRERVFVVRYDRILADFDGLMVDVCAFVGHEMTPAQRSVVEATAASQRAYETKHVYDLAKFGLSEERIREDCAFVYETFLAPAESTATSPAARP